MFETYTIIEFLEDGILVETQNKETIKISKIVLPKFAKKGDRIRRCEHHFYDIVDENGTIIFRKED